jgi:mitochondrial fission protein ELM1
MGRELVPSQQSRTGLGETPRLWLVLGDKGGDNAQAYAVAHALGWPLELKRIEMLEPYVQGKPRVEASLYHVDASRSDPLEPPWPDLVITIGRRVAMVARWIRDQSGGNTKIVLLGKPSGPPDPYDLVIVSGEIQMPALPNVLAITLPLMQVNVDEVSAAASHWRSRIGTLPRPLIAILVGGPTANFRLNGKVAERLLELAQSVVKNMEGTPYITTSRRTPAAVVKALRAGLPAGARLFSWQPDAKENPYLGLLGLADGFVVSGDSISMMVEVIRVGKPLAIFGLPFSSLGVLDQLRRSFARLLFARDSGAENAGLREWLAQRLYQARILTHTRDFQAFHGMLIERGLAVRAGNGFPAPHGPVPDDLAAVVNRIKALMGAGA